MESDIFKRQTKCEYTVVLICSNAGLRNVSVERMKRALLK